MCVFMCVCLCVDENVRRVKRLQVKVASVFLLEQLKNFFGHFFFFTFYKCLCVCVKSYHVGVFGAKACCCELKSAEACFRKEDQKTLS